MAIRTKEELMNSLKNIIGEDTSDDALSLIEDFDDTINMYEDEKNDSTDWKTKYEENDAEWRQKYKDRFFSKAVSDDVPDESEEEEKEEPHNFADLFTNN